MDMPILKVYSPYHGTLEGREQLQYKNFSTIGTAEHNLLDQQCGVGAKTINNEDLMLIEFEMNALESVKRREFEKGSYLMMVHDHHCVL